MNEETNRDFASKIHRPWKAWQFICLVGTQRLLLSELYMGLELSLNLFVLGDGGARLATLHEGCVRASS